MKPDYYCKECGTEVRVTPEGAVTHFCSHVDTTIIAERTSTLFGDGQFDESSLYDRAVAAIIKIFKAFN